ncbi:IMPACT family protein [Pseudoxanthomonas japonensis]|uniref:IMPACT family protein n=1 Tax=Pseudoxanthomonas japonensis TaxID=69284 RepID=A0ABQ6ZKQ5_9GAMM|nr:YigZ family protein [Pseudoxanthomonas japonensis]KAF1726775.1 IMPACT family protein [Pseudoxanthomonas japonensis]PZQ28017.1 MAG: IMPACT family protein [Stenotrophomonas acidaminiphila]
MSDTLAARASQLLEVKHSRFLAQASPVDSADDALAFLREIGDPAATHNCWAYRIGQEYRSSDDGEPAGTAGRPILAAIDGQGFDRVMVVVTRWYGGIKLGAGGLVRAYGGAAAECLRLAPREPLVAWATVELTCPFDDLGHVHAALAVHSAAKQDEDFDEHGARLRVQLPADRVDALKSQLRDATRNRVRFLGPA